MKSDAAVFMRWAATRGVVCGGSGRGQRETKRCFINPETDNKPPLGELILLENGKAEGPVGATQTFVPDQSEADAFYSLIGGNVHNTACPLC